MKKITFLFLPLIFLLTVNKDLFAQCSSGDCENGYGIYLYTSSRYEGYFAGGIRNGRGTIYWSDGDKYVGEWLNGSRTGFGTFYWTSGDIYAGYFKDDKLNGFGTKYFSNGTVYEGKWQDGDYHGYGVLSCGPERFVNNCKDCKVYKGNWLNGVKSGFGRCYDKSDKLIYEGEFLNDKPVGTYPNRF